jgi:hypothetical protein
MAEAAAAEAVEAAARGTDVTQERVENGTQAQIGQEEQHGEDGGQDEEKGRTQRVVVAAFAVLTVGGMKGEAAKEREEEEEEEECAVCLNTIDIDDVDDPTGLQLTCGHRYHAFCLHLLGGAMYEQVH